MKLVCGVFMLFLYLKINKSHHELSVLLYSKSDTIIQYRFLYLIT